MSQPATVLIRGNSLSAAMAAVYLVRQLPAGLVHLHWDRSGPAMADDLMAHAHDDLRKFNRAIRLPEKVFASGTAATFKLCDRFEGFGPAPFALPFAEFGLKVEGQSMLAAMTALGLPIQTDHLAQYCFPVAATQQSRFAPPDSKGRPIVSDYGYGYHLDPARYAQLLCMIAIDKGVTVYDARPNLPDVNFTIETGPREPSPSNIAWSYTPKPIIKSGHDCNGIGRFNRTPAGYTVSADWQIGVQTLDVRLDDQGTVNVAPPINRPWSGNTLYLGPTYRAVHPINGGTLRMTQLDLESLVALWPTNPSNPVEQTEYNDQAEIRLTRLMEFDQLCLAELADPDLLPGLQQKLDLFRARFRLSQAEGNDLLIDQWIPALLGRGLRPKQRDRMAARVDPMDLQNMQQKMSQFIARAVPQMPPHAGFIARHCPARDLPPLRLNSGSSR